MRRTTFILFGTGLLALTLVAGALVMNGGTSVVHAMPFGDMVSRMYMGDGYRPMHGNNGHHHIDSAGPHAHRHAVMPVPRDCPYKEKAHGTMHPKHGHQRYHMMNDYESCPFANGGTDQGNE